MLKYYERGKHMTKDADKMLCCLYREYLNRINAGSSKTSAKDFTTEYANSDDVLCKWHPDDVDAKIQELRRMGYIKVYISGKYQLTDPGITYMENRFKNNINEVADFLTKFIP